MAPYSSFSRFLQPCFLLTYFSYSSFYILVLFSSFAHGQNSMQFVPALYVFGDSTVDGGNSVPQGSYGVDLMNASLPARWTNGKTIADYIAILLGLPLVPPSSNHAQADNSTTGINYAFGGAGILPTTDLVTKWDFDIQIGNFSTTIAEKLNQTFTPEELSNHLKESIFLISFGINDYGQNYFVPNRSSSETPEDFAQDLLKALSERLTTLYRMGGRKFLVNNMWPIGCSPYYHLNNLGICNDTVNYKLLPYTNLMPLMLQGMASDLPGFEYSYSDDFSFNQELNVNKTVITNTTGRCYDSFGTRKLCTDRDRYLYFDNIHTTQASNILFALSCFNGTLCSPKNILGLVRV